jgi:hypothetical protein
MHVMKISTIFFIPVLFFLNGTLLSQESNREYFPAQMSFVYPIGTHGVSSGKMCYNFSLNALTGITGSIEGCEIGGLINTNKGSLEGVQVAGTGNFTSGTVRGVQVGGLVSLTGDVTGVQVNGIFGKAGNVEGLQVSGIANLSETTNVSVGGIANFCKGDVTGLQAGGIMNTAADVKGMQIGGVMNTAGDVKGMQIGGILNTAKDVTGVQIGLVNTANSIEDGIPIGLVSIVRNGFYDEWTISMADYMQIGVSYKAGIRKFYNIYSVGMNYAKDPLWVAGLGFGHIGDINTSYSFQPEIICYTYYPRNFRHIRESYIAHVKLGFVRRLSDKLALFIAPGIYGSLKSNESGRYEDYGYEQSLFDPVVETTTRDHHTQLAMGFGVSVGLNIN